MKVKGRSIYTSTESCLNLQSLHAFLCTRQPQSLVCMKKCVCLCVHSYLGVQHKHTFSCMLGSSRGPFKRSHKFFEKETKELNIFSLQRHSYKVHVKCVFLSALLSK